MRQSRGFRSSLGRVAPWTTALLLLALPVALPNRAAVDGAVEARHAAIVTALGAAPFIAGDWVGKDAPVPREAQELLRPTAILSRSYERFGRRDEVGSPPSASHLHLLIVHCADARDMIGHYPPICYPSSGWTRLDVERADEMIRVEKMGSGLISADGSKLFRVASEMSPDPILLASEMSPDPILPVRVYRFRRERDQGGPESITVLSAFVLPDGAVTRDIGDVSRRSERLALAAQGVAQLQIIAPDEERAGAIDAAGDLLGEMRGLLSALGIGGRKETSP